MASKFWAFEFMYVVNNNLTDCEVCVVATRRELVEAMQAFFAVPRATVLLAEALGAWFGEDATFYDAMPYVKVSIAGEVLPFERETTMTLLGDLEGGELQRRYLSQGRSYAEDATADDAEDTADATLAPFELQFDAEGFLASLPDADGEPLAPDAPLVLRRPVGAEGFAEEMGSDFYIDAEPELPGPGWYVANPGVAAERFDPAVRFRAELAIPMV